MIQAIPNAIGALCLNPVGLAQFNTRPIISRFFSIFSSEKHVKILQDRDNGSLVGAAFDELIRHHPTLKDKVMAATIEALEAIREKGRAYVPEGTGEGYTLQLPVDTEILDGTNPVASSSNAAVEPTPVDAAPADANTPPTPKIEEPEDNQILQCIDVIARVRFLSCQSKSRILTTRREQFLEGLFQNLAHCKDFVKLEPYDLILDLFSLPCAPSLMPGTASFISLCSAFRIISEVKPTEVIGAALKRVKVSMDDAPPLWMNEFTDKAGTLSIIETCESSSSALVPSLTSSRQLRIDWTRTTRNSERSLPFSPTSPCSRTSTPTSAIRTVDSPRPSSPPSANDPPT